MEDIELGDVQKLFANIIWDNEPVGSGELVKICEDKFSWKKSTTYTVLHKLCEKGLFKNENSIVSSLISREDFYKSQSKKFVQLAYDGSLPSFIAAFISNNSLSESERSEIQQIIDSYKKD